MSNDQIFDCMKECKGLFSREELEDLVITITSGRKAAVTKSMFRARVSMEYDDEVRENLYNRIRESRKYWIKKEEISVIKISEEFTKITRTMLYAFDLVEICHDQSTANADGFISPKTLSGTISVVGATKNETRILFEQHIAISTSFRTSYYQSVKLIKPIVVEKVAKYGFRFDFDSSWIENTFFAIIPYSDKLDENGIIKELHYCYSK